MSDTTRPNFFGTFEGFGPLRKGKKSAQREADRWTDSGDGTRYLHPGRTNVSPAIPPHFETVTTEVRKVDGGFQCVYLTTREPVEKTTCGQHRTLGLFFMFGAECCRGCGVLGALHETAEETVARRKMEEAS